MISGWDNGWPDWRDDGRRVLVETLGGTQIECKLTYDDFASDGEGDEWPVWFGVDDQGNKVDFVGAEHWRFVDVEGNK